jgi:LemA protein
MKRSLVLALVTAAGILLSAEFSRVHKGLAGERAEIQTTWSDVETALEHRGGLVAELAQAVEQAAPAEAATVKAALDARSTLDGAQDPRLKIQANAQLDNALARLLLCSEKYPELDHGKQVTDLEDALKDAENDIAIERRKYNDAVEHYNARLALFPNNVVAELSGLHKVDAYFQTAAGVVQ